MARSILGTSAWAAGESLTRASCDGFSAAPRLPGELTQSCQLTPGCQRLSGWEQTLGIPLPGPKGLVGREEKGPVFPDAS